jgi:hypothetical protein
MGVFAPAPVLNGYIDGLILSNSAGDSSNDLDISAGIAVDSGNAVYMRLSEAITKRLDAAWAVGTNQGGRDTGAEASSTWYHVWLISNGGVVDVLFSTSATSPTMPSGYTYKRRIGSIYNSSGSVITAFDQIGDLFLWDAVVVDVNSTNPGTSAVTATLSVPLGVITIARVRARLVSPTTASSGIVTALVTTDAAPTTDGTAPNDDIRGSSAADGRMRIDVPTNTSSQVRYRLNSSSADTVMRIFTLGWTDPRGRTW